MKMHDNDMNERVYFVIIIILKCINKSLTSSQPTSNLLSLHQLATRKPLSTLKHQFNRVHFRDQESLKFTELNLKELKLWPWISTTQCLSKLNNQWRHRNIQSQLCLSQLHVLLPQDLAQLQWWCQLLNLRMSVLYTPASKSKKQLYNPESMMLKCSLHRTYQSRQKLLKNHGVSQDQPTLKWLKLLSTETNPSSQICKEDQSWTWCFLEEQPFLLAGWEEVSYTSLFHLKEAIRALVS
jgi:hypothetical protein